MKKGTWIVFGLVAVLGLLYYFSRENQVSVGIKQFDVPSFSQDKVDQIEITGKNPVVLVKRDDGWKVKVGEPAREVAADKATVTALFDAALSLRSSHYVTNLKEKQEELGFGEGKETTVKLLSKDTSVFHLVLGKNDSGAGRYVKLPDHDEVFVLRGSFWQLTRNGAADFRDREIWPQTEGDIERLVISKADGSELAIVKSSDGAWAFDKEQKGLPDHFRVDGQALANLVRTNTTIRASGFMDDATVSSPSVTAKATKASGVVTVEFFVGADNKYLARRVGDAQVYEISKSSYDRLNTSVEKLRDLSVLKFDKASVKEIVLKPGKALVVVKKTDNQWHIVEPKKLPEKFEFEADSVEDMLTLLSGLNGERVAEAKDVAASPDWQKSWMVELITDKDEKIHLFVGKSKANKDELLVRGNIDQITYVVKAMRLSSVESGLNAFKKEEFVLPPVDENTKGFDTLPVDIQRKLLNVTKEKK